MGLLLDVILPVFVIIGFGYSMAKWGGMSENMVDALMWFAQSIAVPALLFRQMAIIDLTTSFHPGMIGSFYTGGFCALPLDFLARGNCLNAPWKRP